MHAVHITLLLHVVETLAQTQRGTEFQSHCADCSCFTVILCPPGNFIAKRRADISGQDINCNAKDYKVTCLSQMSPLLMRMPVHLIHGMAVVAVSG
jgi:hypothetical protein